MPWALAAFEALTSCRRESGPATSHAAEAFRRGDVVVVERTAAEFFEGRVLQVTDVALKIQTTADGEPVKVAPSDAYRVGGAPSEAAPLALAICNDSPAHWVPCRVMSRNAGSVRVTLSTGLETTLSGDRVLRPSPVTALNIGKVFEVAESRRRFGEAAANAGEPHRPPGWLPEIREPVIARRGSQWFTAHIAALQDDGVRVLFEGSDHPTTVPSGSVVPMPPYPRTVVRGDFALARPASATEPWQRVRVEAIGPDEAVVVGDDGERKRFEARQLVPVVPDLDRRSD